MEVEGDDFNLNIEGRSHDFIAALLYACRKEPALARLIETTANVLKDQEFQSKSDEFFKTKGDA